ncbi:MAG: response regulator [Cyclobacteriaceae bacterium]|nr:response regulator [Cyclobacteriaceae bacterium]
MLNNLTILIVDDHEINIMALAIVLKSKNASVLEAHSGKECIELLKVNSHVDVILMDIMMPEMDGYQTIKKIRQEINPTIPIIALTANAMQGDKQKCIDAGANDYCSKPVDIKEIEEKISALLNR